MHHALEDILDGAHDDQDESNVHWALTYDSEAKESDTPSESYEIQDDEIPEVQKPSILQKAVIDNAANKLDMPTTPVPIYPITINEGDFEDPVPELGELGHSLSPRMNNSFQHFDPLFLPRQIFSTVKTQRTLSLATEIVSFDYNRNYRYYLCLCCPENYRHPFNSPRDLLEHTLHQHRGFVPLPLDPMRLVCPNCLKFYADNSNYGFCSNLLCSPPRRLEVNICGEFYLEGETPRMSGEDTLMAYGTYNSLFS